MRKFIDTLDKSYTVVNRSTGAEYEILAPTCEAALWEVARLYLGKEWLEYNRVEIYDDYLKLGQFVISTGEI